MALAVISTLLQVSILATWSLVLVFGAVALAVIIIIIIIII